MLKIYFLTVQENLRVCACTAIKHNVNENTNTQNIKHKINKVKENTQRNVTTTKY